jgi:hypothetical protein
VGTVQGDQKIEKQIRPVFRKVAKKSQNFNIKPLLKLKIPTISHVLKPSIEVKKLKIAQAKSNPTCSAFFGPLHLFKSLQ